MDSNLYRSFLTLALTLGLAAQAHAIPQLRLQSAATNVLVTDGGVGDANPEDGAVTFIGPVAGWSTNVTSGFSWPVIGTEFQPELDLASFNATSSAGGTLNVWFTDTGFGPASNAAHVLSAIGGTTTGGTVTFRTFYDTTNTAFGMQHEISNQLFSSLGFSGVAGGELTSLTPYSLTLLVTIAHAGRASTSFDALVKVPEPSSLLLLGAGLLGMGVTARRRGLIATRAC